MDEGRPKTTGKPREIRESTASILFVFYFPDRFVVLRCCSCCFDNSVSMLQYKILVSYAMSSDGAGGSLQFRDTILHRSTGTRSRSCVGDAHSVSKIICVAYEMRNNYVSSDNDMEIISGTKSNWFKLRPEARISLKK